MPGSRSRLPIVRAVSAGGVVVRGNGEGAEVLLCHRASPPVWCLPKGTPDPGESIEETALREVREETGVEPRILQSLGSIRYWFTFQGKRYDKTVHHFLMEAIGGDPSLHDHEFDTVEWLPFVEARSRLTYDNEVNVLDRALAALRGQSDAAP